FISSLPVPSPWDTQEEEQRWILRSCPESQKGNFGAEIAAHERRDRSKKFKGCWHGASGRNSKFSCYFCLGTGISLLFSPRREDFFLLRTFP
uniref:Uncharacterized protein n=1 Tax=Serinus canaria TaxID=9135 RepID=A0A8C9KTD3_SERCA